MDTTAGQEDASTRRRRTRGGPTRAPNRSPETIRRTLVDATVELLSERPAARVTVRAIAERAGLQHSLITRHFTSKDELVAVALGELTAEYTAVVEAGSDPADGYLRSLEHLRANPTATMAMAAGSAVRGGDGPSDRFPGYTAHLRQLLAAGAPDDDHTRILAGATLSLVAGWSFLEPNVLDAAGLGDLDPAAVQRDVAGIVARLIERETDGRVLDRTELDPTPDPTTPDRTRPRSGGTPP